MYVVYAFITLNCVVDGIGSIFLGAGVQDKFGHSAVLLLQYLVCRRAANFLDFWDELYHNQQ